MTVPDWLVDDEATASIFHREARPGTTAPFPAWVSPDLRAAAARLGATELWAHQAQAADIAFSGGHLALATGTASGKTLSYLLPVAAACAEGRLGWSPVDSSGAARRRLALDQRHTALYLAPTKALAHDQLRVCRSLGLPGLRAATLDGDSGPEERRFAREFAGYVLTNPDMLHRSVLPGHARWSRFLGSLRFVVIDEAHRYGGVFGAHVAAVLRRLRRLCRLYGSEPTFILASATIARADEVARSLTGVTSVHLIDTDASPAPALDFVLRKPSQHLTQDAADLLAALSARGQTLAFTTSRVQAELVALHARERSAEPSTLAAYRGGYLADDRRDLERRLQTGALRGLACTNALELGVDVSGMDAVVSVGFPGTVGALWQQVGRAGRTDRDALAVLLAREDPLDAFLVAHPDLVFDKPVERTVLYPDNPYVLGPHLAAAAQEHPLTREDLEFFGPTTEPLADKLTGQGVLRRRPAGWFWPHAERAVDSIDLRSMQGRVCEVVDESTGTVIGHVDPAAADRTLYPNAVYVHQGDQWLVRSFDDGDRVATAVRARPDYFTQAVSVGGARVLGVEASRALGLGRIHYGTIELASQVVGYLRRGVKDGIVRDRHPLDLPERRINTRGVWWTLPQDVVTALAIAPQALPGAIHAAEHAATGLLPAIVPCDRWDIGGLSALAHPDTGTLTLFVHDTIPGGSGFSEKGYQLADLWWGAIVDHLASCGCEAGCPACVVSPACATGNDPIDKTGALELARVLTLR